MSELKLNRDEIRNLLPHREPMLLIDELIDIKKLKSATAIMNVSKNSFFVFFLRIRAKIMQKYMLFPLKVNK